MYCFKIALNTITLTLLLDRIKPVCRPLSNFLLYLFYRFNTTISKEEFDRKFYKVKTGKALVLNNNKFEVPGVPLADRRGSDADASAISQRFADIGFDYEIDGDMTAKATFEWFENGK